MPLDKTIPKDHLATFTHAARKICSIYTASSASLNIYINMFPSVPFAASLVNGVWLQKQYGQALEVAVSEGVVKAMMTLVGAVGCLFGICQVEYSDCVKKSPSALLLGT